MHIDEQSMDIESKFTGLRLGIDEGCRVGCIMETSLEAICLFDQKCSKLNYNPNIYGRSKDNKKLDRKKEKCQKIVEQWIFLFLSLFHFQTRKNLLRIFNLPLGHFKWGRRLILHDAYRYSINNIPRKLSHHITI